MPARAGKSYPLNNKVTATRRLMSLFNDKPSADAPALIAGMTGIPGEDLATFLQQQE